MTDSTSTSTSSSTSTPTVLNTPQSDWSLVLSQLLSALGNSQYEWALNEYNSGKEITNANIANFMAMSGKGAGLADTLIKQYQNQFSPVVQQYLAQAASYNSPERQQFQMGRAESQVAQAMTAARSEAERKIRSYGGNPNDGKSREIQEAGRLQDAAARAGAGTQAALDTADRGRAMTEKAVQFGQNVPGMAVNAMNSAYQGVVGAQNANLGQQNTGAALTSSAAPFMSAAAGALKMPPTGQTSSGGSQSQQKSSSPDNSNNRNTQPGRGVIDPTARSSDTQTGPGGNGLGAPSAANFRAPGGGGGIAQIMNLPQGPDGAGGVLQEGEGTEGAPAWEGGDPSEMIDGAGGQADPSAQDNTYGDFGQVDTSSYGEPSQGADMTNYDAQSYSNPDTSYDPGTGADMTNYQDTSYDSGSYDSGGGDESFAQGGGVLPTSGGAVPKSASPSQGQQTDDISARLNAGEFVIPRDVVAHQGTRFFDNLISKSRKLRTGMAGPPARPTMKPALQQKPTFNSKGVM